jgi:alpha-beta hydrolase superfamily lysophospholipase
LNCEKITIEQLSIPGTGFDVPGVVLLPTKPPHGAAVIIHGYGGDKEEQMGLAWRVAAAGIVACPIDLRGHGEHKATMDGDILQDAEAAIKFCRRYGKVAAIGHSMGGRLALLSDADYAIAISPAFSKVYRAQTREKLTAMRSYRVREAYPGQNFDVLMKMPVWQYENGKKALVIFGERDVPDIVNSCNELRSQGGPVVRIDNAVHSDIFLLEDTFRIVTEQLNQWFK